MEVSSNLIAKTITSHPCHPSFSHTPRLVYQHILLLPPAKYILVQNLTTSPYLHCHHHGQTTIISFLDCCSNPLTDLSTSTLPCIPSTLNSETEITVKNISQNKSLLYSNTPKASHITQNKERTY